MSESISITWQDAPEIQYIRTPGEYMVEVTKTENAIALDGSKKLVLTFVTDDGQTITDALTFNDKNVRRNQVAVAVLHPKAKFQIGQTYKLHPERLIGTRVKILVAEEAYTNKAGEAKTICKVKRWFAAPQVAEDDIAF